MREKLYRFMQGRYGTDKLNQFIFYVELILLVLSLFFRRNIVINILFYISIIIYLARALSKNYVARSIENQKFIRIQAKIVHRFQAFNKSLKDKQNYNWNDGSVDDITITWSIVLNVHKLFVFLEIRGKLKFVVLLVENLLIRKVSCLYAKMDTL